MKKNLFLFAGLLLTAQTYAGNGTPGTVPPKEITFVKDIFRTPDPRTQEMLRNGGAWKNFLQQHGAWGVIFNEENGKPHRAYGSSIRLNYAGDVKDKALSFIKNELSGFLIPVNDLQLGNVNTSPKYHYIDFYQTYKGLDVLNSRATVRMTHDDRVILFGLDVFDNINVNTMPTLSSSAAASMALSGLSGTVHALAVLPELKILPVPADKQYTFHLVYTVNIELIDEDGFEAKYYTLIDAASGEILYRTNKVYNYANADVNVKATIKPMNPYSQDSVVNLKHLRINDGTTDYFTDDNGDVSIPGSPLTGNVYLEGQYCQVVTQSGTTAPVFSSALNTGTNNLSFDGNAAIHYNTAYYHVNVIHDFMKSYMPTFTGMDTKLRVKMDLTSGKCNGMYNGSSLNFYAKGTTGCNSLALISDVVYHEYGHGITGQFYSSKGQSNINGGLNEGYSDVWAFSVTHYPRLAQGILVGDSLEYSRSYDIDKRVYPQDNSSDPHHGGQIIAGCWWDVAINLGSFPQMTALFVEALNGLANGSNGQEGQAFTDHFIDALEADDDDGNLNNGTPNALAIASAFGIHGISLQTTATINHSEILTALPIADINVNVLLSSIANGWGLKGVNLYYKINQDLAWTKVALTASGSNYSGVIPAQPTGTLIKYHLALEDIFGSISKITPFKSNFADDPGNPYYILVGFKTLGTEDFDTNTLGTWATSVAADDATSGRWVIADPFYTRDQYSVILQPSIDHTTGAGVKCAVTGNAGADNADKDLADVGRGTTTLESPVLDLSTSLNPAFAYYRYFTNNRGSFLNDPWIVQISGDGINWVPIENTLVDDKTWRRVAFRVKDYITPTTTTQIRFIASDKVIPGINQEGQSTVEALVDDVILYDEDPALAVAEYNNDFGLHVYPNPSKENFTAGIQLHGTQDVTVEVRDLIGKLVYTKLYNNLSSGGHNLLVPTGELAGSVYMLSVKAGNSVVVKKLALVK